MKFRAASCGKIQRQNSKRDAEEVSCYSNLDSMIRNQPARQEKVNNHKFWIVLLSSFLTSQFFTFSAGLCEEFLLLN